MAYVLISYHAADKNWAEEIQPWMVEDGHTVWSAQPEALEGDKEWNKRLSERLGFADAIIPVITPSYLGSTWCNTEMAVAHEFHNEILPVRVSSERLEDLLVGDHVPPILRKFRDYGDVERDPSGTRERLRARLSVIDEQTDLQAQGDERRRRLSERFDPKPNGIFVCYRREDSRWQTGRLVDALANRFGESAVFMDVDRVRIGNWRKQTDESLAECAAVIVVIGPRWQAELDSRPALHDQVRYEITQALRLGKTIIPVAVDRARLPDHSELPDDIAAITDAQGYELGLDVMWRPTVGKLLDDLSALLQDNSATQ